MGKCEYCGKSTPFKMPLCKEHYDMQQAGTLKKDTHGNWILTKPKKEIKEDARTTDITYEKCIVCGANSNGRPQCPDCYDETKEYMDEIDKNSDVSKLREHYYHLKDYIFRLIPTKNLKNIKLFPETTCLYSMIQINENKGEQNHEERKSTCIIINSLYVYHSSSTCICGRFC